MLEPPACAVWLEAHRGWLRSLALAAWARLRPRLASRQTDASAEDAVQEASLRIWRAWDRWNAALGTRESWAATILVNVVRDARRAHQSRYDTYCRLVALWPGEVRRQSVDPESAACDADLVARAWVQLTARERVWVTLLAQGYTYTETARRYGVPSDTLKAGMHAMRQRLSVGN